LGVFISLKIRADRSAPGLGPLFHQQHLVLGVHHFISATLTLSAVCSELEDSFPNRGSWKSPEALLSAYPHNSADHPSDLCGNGRTSALMSHRGRRYTRLTSTKDPSGLGQSVKCGPLHTPPWFRKPLIQHDITLLAVVGIGCFYSARE